MMALPLRRRSAMPFGAAGLALTAFVAASAPDARGQNPRPSAPAGSSVRDSVAAILPPVNPLPSEAASAGVSRFSFIVYGDTRGRHDGIEPQAEHFLVIESMLAAIKASAGSPDPIRFVLQSGDAVYSGRDASQWNVSYTPRINRLTTDGNVPYFLAVGNHDVSGTADPRSPLRAVGLRNYFSANARLIPPEGSRRRLNGYPTYAFGYGNTFVIGFDSNIADDSTQFAWVKGQLEGLDRRRFVHVVVFCHHPAFSSGPHGGAGVEAPTAALRARYMPLFRRHHVRMLLVGHEHLFEHWVERYRDSTGTHRLDQIVTGGGGAPLYAYRGEPDLREYLRASAADSTRVEHLVRPGVEPGENPFHYVIVHVDGARIRVEVVGVDWGRGFSPYRSAGATLDDPPKRP